MPTTLPAGWKPISSAPKDGTEILAWRSDCGQFIASYTSADAFPMTQDELDAWDEETLFAKDWFTQWPQALRLEGSEVPTLWQPMPADPCLTCGGHGLVGGLTPHSGYDAEPCPDCTPPASAQDDAKDERQAFEAWGMAGCEMVDDPQSGRLDIARHCAWEAWKARASIAAPAAGDARMARELLPKLQSLLDRMANDAHTGTMFEADGDTLRDAMHLCRSVVVDAASQQQEG